MPSDLARGIAGDMPYIPRNPAGPANAEEGTIYPDERAKLERLRHEVRRLNSQVQSLRSALVVNLNLAADLLLLADDPDTERRMRARTRIVDATSEIGRRLAGPSFSDEGPNGGWRR